MSTPKRHRVRRAPFTDGGGAAPATMAVDARPRPGEAIVNIHGPVALVQRGDNNVASVVMTTLAQKDRR